MKLLVFPLRKKKHQSNFGVNIIEGESEEIKDDDEK